MGPEYIEYNLKNGSFVHKNNHEYYSSANNKNSLGKKYLKGVNTKKI